MSAQTVQLRNLVKIFAGPGGEKVVAVDDVSLQIEQGEMVTLLGPSGCGKTTTLRMVAGFETPDTGQIIVGDEDISRRAPNKRDTAMVFQSYALFPHMTVRQNVAYGLRFKNLGKGEADERVDRIMKLVGLEGYDRRSPGQLSGGQQQRVALARSLVVEPQVLLFDEPLSNLDAKLREQMREEIRGVQQRLKITSLYVTHDQIEAMSLSDRIVVMNKGKIEQVGPPEDIYRHPTTRFVAEFIGKVNFFPVEVVVAASGHVDVEVFGQAIRMHSRYKDIQGQPLLMCRPEALEIRRDEGVPSRVRKANYLGSWVEYVVELPDGTLALAVHSNPIPDEVFPAGAEVGVRIDGANAHLLSN